MEGKPASATYIGQPSMNFIMPLRRQKDMSRFGNRSSSAVIDLPMPQLQRPSRFFVRCAPSV